MAGFSDVLWFIGAVENNVDERLEGRIQVRAFGIHGTPEQIPTTDLPWATLIIGNYDTNFIVPPLNSWVFGFFMDGRDAQHPMILGLIPTQHTKPIDPINNGWGSTDMKDYDRKAMGSRPEDLGQPSLSRLTRGEDIQNTYNAALEITRVKDIPLPNNMGTWSEPSSAYNAQYPFNRAIETSSGHSVEIDDTPGAERIMVYHRSGSYVQIDARGTTTHKATGDKYDINESNQHVYIGGKNVICIEGDSYVYVKGNKYEEILGDYKQVVHGNHEISSAGQINLNASDELQFRAAKVTGESKVENMSLKGAKEIRLSSGTGTHINSSAFINMNGSSVNLKAGSSISIDAGDAFSAKSAIVKIGGGDKISMSASMVAIDDFIQLSSGSSDAPDGVDLEVMVANSADMPEPATKSANVYSSTKGNESVGTVGYSSSDGESENPAPYLEGYTSSCASDVVEEIAKYETFHASAFWDYKQWSIGYGTKANSKDEVIDEPEARRRLTSRISSDQAFVRGFARQYNYTWNDCQVDALTSFIYNLGSGTLKELTDNGTRDNATIANKILEYYNAGGQRLEGLVKRRISESEWFKNGMTNENATEIPTGSTNSGTAI